MNLEANGQDGTLKIVCEVTMTAAFYSNDFRQYRKDKEASNR